MPVYCFVCERCEQRFEQLERTACSPKTSDCPRCNTAARRDFHAEVPCIHTDDSYHWTPHFDTGAGRFFETWGQYKRWQREATVDGVPPEKISMSKIDEALHRNETGELPEVTDKEYSKEIERCYDAGEKEYQRENRITVATPLNDQA